MMRKRFSCSEIVSCQCLTERFLFSFVLRAVVCDRNCFDFGGLRGMNERIWTVEYGISWGVAGGRPGCVREIGRGKRGKGRE